MCPFFVYVKSDRARGAYTQPDEGRGARANLDLPLPPGQPSPNTPTPSPDSTRPGDPTPRCRAGSNTDAKQRGELLELRRGRVVDELVAHLNGVPYIGRVVQGATERHSRWCAESPPGIGVVVVMFCGCGEGGRRLKRVGPGRFKKKSC